VQASDFGYPAAAQRRRPVTTGPGVRFPDVTHGRDYVTAPLARLLLGVTPQALRDDPRRQLHSGRESELAQDGGDVTCHG
jgi:hypothetical protein